MEPMCLSNSPKTSASSPGVNPNFLPAYLMGGNSQPTSPNQNIIGVGPVNKTVNFKTTPNSVEPKNLRQKLFQQTVNESQFPSYDNVSIDKGGPPKVGLFDTLNTSTDNKAVSPITNSTAIHDRYDLPSFNINDSFIPKTNDSIMNLSAQNYEEASCVSPQLQQNHIGNNIHQERNGVSWLTVFGFPPSAVGLVLAQFSNFGTIVEKQLPSQGNWMNIKYSSAYEATKALSMHGKLISNCIMVGVMPCSNNECKQDCNKENLDSSNHFMSPGRTRMLNRQTFHSPHLSNEVVQTQSVPQKSTGLVSKAMEYIFGW